MTFLLLQSSEFGVWQQAVRGQFQRNGSTTAFLLVALSLVGLVLFVGWLHRLQNHWQQRDARAGDSPDPLRLYSHLLFSLGLSVSQRDLMETLARDLKVVHPTALLISERLFDEHVERWTHRHVIGSVETRAATATPLLLQIRTRLFPGGGPGIVSSNAPPR